MPPAASASGSVPNVRFIHWWSTATRQSLRMPRAKPVRQGRLAQNQIGTVHCDHQREPFPFVDRLRCVNLARSNSRLARNSKTPPSPSASLPSILSCPGDKHHASATSGPVFPRAVLAVALVTYRQAVVERLVIWALLPFGPLMKRRSDALIAEYGAQQAEDPRTYRAGPRQHSLRRTGPVAHQSDAPPTNPETPP
jgi:hypothetical protein